MGRYISQPAVELPRIAFERSAQSARPAKRAPRAAGPASPAAWLTDASAPLTFPRALPATSGVSNSGNTCYLAAAVQCLAHVAPFAAVLARQRVAPCTRRRFCGHCALAALWSQMTDARRPRAVQPGLLSNNVHLLSRALRPGRMEDAHEFLSALLTSFARAAALGCERSGLAGAVLTPAQEERSPVRSVFGGTTQSAVSCGACNHVSARDEPFTELPLDIYRARSVPQALRQFCGVEHLAGANMYFCEVCKQKVRATKRLSVRKAPNSLVLVLKRFIGSGKSNKFVEYPATLDLSPHMPAVPEEVDVGYYLSGVLVHSGSSCRSGHYFAFVKSPNGVWRKKDDGSQSIVGERVALSQRAYILFYTRNGERPARHTPREMPVAGTHIEQNGESDASQSTNPDLPSDSGSISPLDQPPPRAKSSLLCAPVQEPLVKQSAVAKLSSKGQNIGNEVSGAKTTSPVPSKTPGQSHSVLPISTPSKQPTPTHTKLVTSPAAKPSTPPPSKLHTSPSKRAAQSPHKMQISPPSVVRTPAPSKPVAPAPSKPVAPAPSRMSEETPAKSSAPTAYQRANLTSSKAPIASPFELSAQLSPQVEEEQGLCTPYSLGLAAKNIPDVVSGIRTLMVIGVETAKRAVYRAFRADQAAAIETSVEKGLVEKPTRPAPADHAFRTSVNETTRQMRTYRRPGTRSASALFGEQGVGLWGSEKDERATPEQTGAIEKRKRAHDELDAEYDAGKAKKVRKKVTVSKTAFHDFAQKKTAGIRATAH